MYFFNLLIMNKIKCFLTLLVFVINLSMNAQNVEGKFKIHCFGSDYSEKFDLGYGYHENWHNFVNNANLDKAYMAIDENDIEEYRWEKQWIKLNVNGHKKLKKIGVHSTFLITLNEERYYAGLFLEFYSAMGVAHPVIYFDANSFDGWWDGSQMEIVPKALIDSGKMDRIKEYFQVTGKCR